MGAIVSPPILKRLIASVGILSLGLVGCVQPRDLSVQAQQPVPVQPQPQSPSSLETLRDRAGADVNALVKLGPRVAGTPAMEQASAYLLEEYRKAGYVADIQTFTYSKFEDRGSSVSVGGTTLQGRALRRTAAGTPMARLVAVPNVGEREDFAVVPVKGAIAIVRRGTLPFAEKVRNAAAAGAVGLLIVNNESGSFSGTLTQDASIPVLALSREQGQPLLERSQRERLTAKLTVNAGQRTVTGRNVVAHLPGVTQPQVLLGGHYDSVLGSPGANDNASGTATVLSIARQLSKTPLGRQAWFVAFDGEEDGLHGSKAFVNAAGPQFLKGLKGMLNFDMVGVNSSLLISGTPSLTKQVQVENAKIASLGSDYGSDHASFSAAGVPVLFFYRGMESNYHKPSDRQINPTLLTETAQAALKMLPQLVSSNATGGSEGNRQ